MTVKELIENLKQFDENLYVEIYADCESWDIKTVGLEKDIYGNDVVTIY